MKLGILGGTFDPIHKGHLRLATEAKKQFSLDRVFFVPALIPPHKMTRRDMTAAPYRFDMVKLALSDESHFEACDAEMKRPEISYTVETLRYFKKRYPTDDLYFIIGADSLAEMPTWKEPDVIEDLARLVVAKRPGAIEVESDSNKVLWLDMPLCEIASSDIRGRIRQHQPVNELLPEKVLAYIQKKNLYQES